MILKNIKIKSFFLSNVLGVIPLILLLSLLLTLLPTHVQAGLGAESIALGPDAQAPGDGAIAIGHDANAGGVQSISIGTGASTPVVGSIAIGQGAVATQGTSLALGSRSNGISATTLEANSTAVGAGTRTDVEGGTAFGHMAHAQHQYSVALGAYSTTSADYTVSVGSGQAGQPHQYRRITHVASPVDDHDAATKGYVDQDSHVQVKNLDDQVNKVNAMRVSTDNARIRIPEGKSTAVGIGVGSYQQAKATTLAVKQRGPGRFNGLQLSGNFTLSNSGDKAGGAGIGYAF